MQMHGNAGGQVRRARRAWNAGSRLHGDERAIGRIHAALRPGGRLFVIDAHFRRGPPRLARLLYRGVMGANGDDVLGALRARFDRVEPVVGADRVQVPFGEVAWPPVAAGPATKADRTNFDNV